MTTNILCGHFGLAGVEGFGVPLQKNSSRDYFYLRLSQL